VQGHANKVQQDSSQWSKLFKPLQGGVVAKEFEDTTVIKGAQQANTPRLEGSHCKNYFRALSWSANPKESSMIIRMPKDRQGN